MSHRTLRRFRQDESGSTAIMFALSLVPVVFAAGAALDYSRADNLRTKLQAATDGTLLNLCQANASLTQAQLQEKALKSVQSYLPNAGVTIDSLVVTNDPRQITLTTRANYETTFAKITGITEFPLTVRGSCSAEERLFEIALALDTTGSMAISDGTMSKIEALRKAATSFVDFVFTTGTMKDHSKVSLVPFAAAVAVNPSGYRTATWIDQEGKSSLHWQNLDPSGTTFKNRLDVFTKLRSSVLSWDWAGCFESLPYPLNVSDGKPDLLKGDTLYVPMFAPDEAGDGGSLAHTETSTGKFQRTSNSYVDDANNDSGCTSTPPDDKTRMMRGCKYAPPKDASTSNGRGPNHMCRSRPLTRLTNNASTLKGEISALQANGNTNIHEGTLWAWRTLSPNSVFADGVAYKGAKTTKVLVVMTDGMNTWGAQSNTLLKSNYSAYGYWSNANGSSVNSRLPPANANPTTDAQARAAMDALTRETCANARAAGVMIYTVGFSIANDPIDQQGLDLLKDCAGSPERAFVANNSSSLIEAFQKIAKGIGSLRITQ